MQRQTIGETVIRGRLLLFIMGQLMGLTIEQYMLVFSVQSAVIDAQFACQYLEQNGRYINRFGVKDMQRQKIGEMVIRGRLSLFMMGQLMGLTMEQYMLVFSVQCVDIDAQFACQYLGQNGQYINKFGVKDMQCQTIGEMVIRGRLSLLVRCFVQSLLMGFVLP